MSRLLEKANFQEKATALNEQFKPKSSPFADIKKFYNANKAGNESLQESLGLAVNWDMGQSWREFYVTVA